MTATATPPFSVIPLGDLVESKTNPRRQFDKKALDELAESIAAHGVLQPILVRPAKKGYEIVAGARRFRASQKAKVAGVPCIVRELDDKQVLEVQVIENLQREDVHPLEEGVGFRTLHTKHGYTVEDLAAKLGKSKAFVYQRMKLAELPAKVQKLFLAGKLETSHAVLVARIPDPKLAEKAAAEISRRGFDGRPIAYRNAVDLVRREFQCELSTAPFPTADAELVPGVGACGPCPKRTGNLRGLFEDVDKDERSNVCTDPKCFAKKAAAQWAVRKAQVAKAEGTVIEGKAAFNARHDSRYVNPDDTDWHSPGNKKWKTMCRGREPKTVLIQGRDGEALERWDRREALAAAKANGHKVGQSPRSSGSGRSEETKRKKAHARRMKVVDEVAPLVGKQA
ncbi:MAG: ParB/RepB/Spo0J family partition protein, partial [Planctomycetes bacterium]|nr:ParB/RepB/Spo0J family partition protein [Planctomycetota bacterium]